MALKPLTVRLEPDLAEYVKREAQRKGLSANQFMASAILARVAFCLAQRGETAEGYEGLYGAAEQAVRSRDAGA